MQEKDIKLLKALAYLKEDELLSTLAKILREKYDEVHETEEYVYAVGSLPIAFLSHCDTVFKHPPGKVYYDPVEQVMLASGEGCGWDDRAGVFIILKLIQAGYRPSIIFTVGEEIGGIGAQVFAAEHQDPLTQINFLIELDRRGKDDCVFYECNNPEFIDYIEKFGFNENFGSFTDISIIAPKWGIAAVNLSVGYDNEHTASEILYLNYLFNTLEKVKLICEEKEFPYFEYISLISNGLYDNYPMGYYDEFFVRCNSCGNIIDEFEAIPIKTENGMKYYCQECCTDNIDWCMECGEPYIVIPGSDGECPNCKNKEKKIKIRKNKGKKRKNGNKRNSKAV